MVVCEIGEFVVIDEDGWLVVFWYKCIGQWQWCVGDICVVDIECLGDCMVVGEYQCIDVEFVDFGLDLCEFVGFGNVGILEIVYGDWCEWWLWLVLLDGVDWVVVDGNEFGFYFGVGGGQVFGCCKSVQLWIKFEVIVGCQMC